MRDLTNLFAPRSVVVVGVSRSPEKIGSVIYRNILQSGFSGKVYAVNPAWDLKDVFCLPETPDLAIIAIPAVKVPQVLEQVGRRGIKNVVILSAGFKETGNEGLALENQLATVANKYALNVLGPNCLGFVNNLVPINATFGQTVKNPPTSLRFISQSGALATGLFDWFTATGVSFSEFITLGNKTIINENDILEYFSSKDGPVGMYLESLADGQKFLAISKKLSLKNPLFLLKPGKSQEATRAMQTHTGAIAGEDYILEAALQEAGIIRCRELADFFDLTKAISWGKIPNGPKIAVISNAGGPAVICADAIAEHGLQLAEISSDTQKQIAQILPRTAAIINPVDVLGDALASRYIQAADIILGDEQTDALVAILTPQLVTQIEATAKMLGELNAKHQKPIFATFIGGKMINQGETVLNQLKIPSFRFPEQAIKALGAMWQWKKFQTKHFLSPLATLKKSFHFESKKIKELLEKPMGGLEVDQLLQLVGIKTPENQAISSFQEAKEFADRTSYPVVLKLSNPNLLHKTETGGVIVNIETEKQLLKAWEQLAQKRDKDSKIQIQKHINGEVEVIIGIKYDPTFGYIMLFGAGGKFTELLADRNLALLPIDHTKAVNLVAQSRISKVLWGWRGKPVLALNKLYDLMVQLSLLVGNNRKIKELEINPAIITVDNVWPVDGKIVLQ